MINVSKGKHRTKKSIKTRFFLLLQKPWHFISSYLTDIQPWKTN